MSAPYVDLGAVSAYAAAREGGYTGTYQQFCALLANVQPKLEAGQNIAITGNVIGTRAFPCNPNLLDNWYFARPVNQRGQTSYSGGDANVIYTIDRWKAPASVSVLDGGITAGNVFQPLEASIRTGLNGKTVTASCLLMDGTLVSGTNTFSEDVVFVSGDITLLTNSFWNNSFQIFSSTAKNILAVKLELGTEQTLAHQDTNGNWVLNEIQDYGEQLRRCQRYFYRKHLDVAYQGLGYGMAFTTSRLRMYIPLPVPMRTGPSATAWSAGENDMEAISTNPGAPNTFSLSSCTYMQWPDPDTACIEFTASGLTAGAMYQVRTDASASVRYIDFSAEL